jgi:hypothetical protein
MMTEDYYHDDPIAKPSSRWLSKKLLTTAVVFFGSVFFFQTTLASNISINSSTGIEFGQGVSVTAACSGSTDLTMTPKTTFLNGSNSAGTHYLSSITLSGIPDNCKGADFLFSAYDSTTATALPIFGTTKTVARVWNNNGTFQGGTGYSGSTITSSAGTFTVTFTTPVALANSVAKITLQSSSHAALNCVLDGICAVGDSGPGGGTVYFVSASAFSAPGSICDTNCHYLEVAKKRWDGSNDADSVSMQLSSTSATLPAQDQGTSFGAQVGTYRGTTEKNNWFIGQGFINTKLIAELTGQTTTNSVAARARAFAPVGYTSTVGQWFVPSFNELNELCKYANGQTTGNTSVQCLGNTPFLSLGTTTSEGFKGTNNYFSSSIRGTAGAISTSVIYFGNGESNSGVNFYNDFREFRPVRVF